MPRFSADWRGESRLADIYRSDEIRIGYRTRISSIRLRLGYLPIPERILPMLPGRGGRCSAAARHRKRPLGLVRQLTAQFERGPVQDSAVEPRRPLPGG